MTESSFLARRLDAKTWPIAVGDLVVLLAFFLAGTLRHWTLTQLRVDPTIYLAAAGPFLLGWAVAAPLVGAYSPGARSAPNSSIPLAIRAWVPAAFLGIAVRILVLDGRGSGLVFAAIVLVGGAVVLAVWRFLYFMLR